MVDALRVHLEDSSLDNITTTSDDEFRSSR